MSYQPRMWITSLSLQSDEMSHRDTSDKDRKHNIFLSKVVFHAFKDDTDKPFYYNALKKGHNSFF